MTISIIIPTLNESQNIVTLLTCLKNFSPEPEIIVSDCGSQDDTADLAKPYATVIQSSRGRAVQMNEGAKAASGDILWFIHADCIPHPNSIASMGKALEDLNIVGGAFEYGLNHPHSYFRLTEWMSNKKNQLMKLIFGDMGIFVRRSIFEKMGGYTDMPLMEDMDYCRRLKKMGKIVILPERIQTSTRRWEEEGWANNVVRNWLLQTAYILGVAPKKLSRFYHFN